MFDPKLYSLTPEGQTVACMTRLPNHMLRTKEALLRPIQDPIEIDLLRTQGNAIRADLDDALEKLRSQWLKNSGNDPGLWHCHFLRSYTLALAIAIIINEARLALYPTAPLILSESLGFAKEIVRLSHVASQYRPLGASSLGVCLMAAEYASLADPEVMLAVREMRNEYAGDFSAWEGRAGKVPELICGRKWSTMLEPGL
jgi:hypothetical protein